MAGRFGKRLIGGLLGCVAVAASLVPPQVRAATPEQVDQAIRKGVEYLYSQQKGDSWDPPTRDDKKHGVEGAQWGGLTSIAVYALLAAGEKPQNSPKLKAGIEWLKKQEGKITGTYAVGLRAQVWNLIPMDEEVRKCIQRDALTLLEGAQKDGTGKNFDGMWHYTPQAKSYDHSCSQYGTLGLWALERAGLELPDALWKATEDQWRKNQIRDGTWGYQQGAVPSDSKSRTLNMTAAGIATLFITQDYLRANDGIKCTGNVSNPAIDKGMKWMEENLHELMSKGQVAPYGMYGIERIGVASGYKYFGTVDWYKEGADRLVKTQRGNDWGGVPNTAFCILFLTRGRAPVVMNKLQYNIDGKEANWNQRPRDAANAVQYMMKQMERDLNWQIVNLNIPVDELHDAPILYISGNQALKFTAEEETKLKQFVHQGGIILGHADCGDAKFANSFKALGTKLFKYEFRPLERDHPIYTRQQFLWKNWKKDKPDLQAMSNGVREVMLLFPGSDPAKAWQLADDSSKEEQFQVLNNIFLYAVEGRDLRFKGSTYLVNAEKKPVKQTIKVGRLQVGENWDPEPGGWNRLAAVMNNTQGTTVQVVPVKADAKDLKDLKVVHFTGTTKVTLSEPQQKALKDFIAAGGTLVIDAAGGNTEFAGSVETALGQMFPQEASQLREALPPSHDLYNLPGAKITEVLFRPFARGKLPAGQRTPLLRGITVNDRVAVILSREDLSGGLVGESVDGIHGYTPASATDLMRNLLLFGGVAKAAPTTGPTTGPATGPATKPSAATKPASPATKPASAATAPAK